ncbi:MAG: peptidoglycan recognition family protein [Planctomycetota bacterium]
MFGRRSLILAGICGLLFSCQSPYAIIVAGEAVPFDGKVVTFRDAAGYDANLKTCFFDRGRILPSNPAAGCDVAPRFRVRPVVGLSAETVARVEKDGWDRKSLGEKITQFVVHYDVCATSQRCFKVLHDIRGLSVHFLLDIDGTLYQTLDLQERARHAGLANDHSIGIEIAHIGAYPPGDVSWEFCYGSPDSTGRRSVQPPVDWGGPAGRYRTARGGLFEARIHGREYEMPDYSEAQYRTLERLFDWVAREFPRVPKKTPLTSSGDFLWEVLPPDELKTFRGFIGHHHLTKSKTDPGPAFDWARVLADRP